MLDRIDAALAHLEAGLPALTHPSPRLHSASTMIVEGFTAIS